MQCNVRSGLIRQCHVVMSCHASASVAMSCTVMSRYVAWCNAMQVWSDVMSLDGRLCDVMQCHVMCIHDQGMTCFVCLARKFLVGAMQSFSAAMRSSCSLSDRPSGIASLEVQCPVDASQETRRWCELKRLGAIHGATPRKMYER